MGEGVLPQDGEFLCAMQEQVHPGDGGGGKILLLAENMSVGSLLIVHLSDGFDQHTAGTAGRVIHGFSRLGCQQPHHQADNGTRGIEFSGVLFAQVSKLLDQEFIGIAHDIR